jgi:hypothetical protein
MKVLTILLLLIFISCNNADDKAEDKASTAYASPSLTPLQTNVNAAIIDINKKEIEGAGHSVNSIQVDGMEIIDISRKTYYIIEKETQEATYKKYKEYLKRFANTNSPLNDPNAIMEGDRKHNAVMAYLEKEIRTASPQPVMYKVTYYLKAATSGTQYDQSKTTFLDKEFKKITADYSFLK